MLSPVELSSAAQVSNRELLVLRIIAQLAENQDQSPPIIHDILKHTKGEGSYDDINACLNQLLSIGYLRWLNPGWRLTKQGVDLLAADLPD